MVNRRKKLKRSSKYFLNNRVGVFYLDLANRNFEYVEYSSMLRSQIPSKDCHHILFYSTSCDHGYYLKFKIIWVNVGKAQRKRLDRENLINNMEYLAIKPACSCEVHFIYYYSPEILPQSCEARPIWSPLRKS